ncbi:class I SAM-dependent methyltransferase [Actinomadura sp. DC4]|uniref:class I SAM-dependent methyltransferase n=1 Tax=Actinomadura sp. DC4 TaxID=3055069 RepID=UPI0025B16D02|nr:class I SAM-dependent methyltransferase [Actinomadura sp. DC4]MDN3355664.1 class I SAM-dependent methyltransferase [Actinomadura sp. DC4]
MVPRASSTVAPPAVVTPPGRFRTLSLFRAFRTEQTDPERFYTLLAADTVRQVERHVDLAGRTVVDVGGGSGYFSAAFEDRGAHCLLIEPDPAELRKRGEIRPNSVVGDGFGLPLKDASVDVSFSSNVLEHVSDPAGFLDEMVRVTRPGGVVYVAYTLWLSPWGGHETSPWHFLGGSYAARRYARKHGHPPKNHYGESLFALRAGRVLRLVRARGDVTVLEARPRYYPRWCGFLVRLPGLRELLTWNLMLVFRRDA